jgi:hypothetical protein
VLLTVLWKKHHINVVAACSAEREGKKKAGRHCLAY